MPINKDEIALFWFRRDLRIADNAGLFHALKSGLKVLPIFIFDPNILGKLANKQDARVTFIHKQISELNNELRSYQSTLVTLHNDPTLAFEELIKAYNITSVYTNNDYEPNAISRDEEIKNLLTKNNIAWHSFKDHVIFEKDDILKADKKPYTVFTPYKNQWKLKFNESCVAPYPSANFTANFKSMEYRVPISLEELGFIKSELKFPPISPNNETISNYEAQRNFPALSTTQMGLHLRFGTVSIRQMVEKASHLSEIWLSELIWREFFMMIIYHFPHSSKNAFKPAYNHIAWRTNEADFERWCNGQTGFPLVDAGMRELNATGFMHNRVRMVTASFLCKNLLLDWRWGEAYFAEKLLDYDVSANVGNWQWAAGSGCDAAPYFRVFSPTLQAEKFDKHQEYIRKWIPELNTPNYPAPMVDAKQSAKKAIEVYKLGLTIR